MATLEAEKAKDWFVCFHAKMRSMYPDCLIETELNFNGILRGKVQSGVTAVSH